MKKIVLTSVICALMAVPAMAANNPAGTNGSRTLNMAAESIDRITNSWGVIEGLADSVHGKTNATEVMNGLIGWATTDLSEDNPYYNTWNDGATVADNAQAMFGIINDTGLAVSGLYTGVVQANEAIALNSAAIDQLGKQMSAFDARLNDMNDELSAGIASVAALSSVAVSDVAQGEMSVGGGYGYHNGQSAGAVGFAIGLTDDWSVNAGAGFSAADITVRAGTNYKFKLF